MSGNDRANKSIDLPSGTTIFWVGATILIGIAAAFAVISVQTDAVERGRKRVNDLVMIKRALTEHAGTFGQGTIYPRTFTPDIRSYSQKKQVGWTNECDQSDNWIPGIGKALGYIPQDPNNSCRARIEREGYPRYQYISDGFNFKVGIYRLEGEVCSEPEFKKFEDPARPCDSNEASWAVYTEGAAGW